MASRLQRMRAGARTMDCNAVKRWLQEISKGLAIAAGGGRLRRSRSRRLLFRTRARAPLRRSAQPTCRTSASSSGSTSRYRSICNSRMRPARRCKLGDYFKSGRPVILNLVYYTCPMLCGEELAGEASALGVLRFTPGNEYEVVSVSFNPDETPQRCGREEADLHRAHERASGAQDRR